MAQVYKNVIFRNKIPHSDEFGLRSPFIQKQKAEMCYRRTRLHITHQALGVPPAMLAHEE